MLLEKPEIIIINRIPTLRKLTVVALIRLGWGNLIEFSNITEGSNYLENNKINSLVILEINATKTGGEIELIEKLRGQLPIIVTLQVPNKELILGLSKAGASNILVKTFDISEYSNKLDATLRTYVST